MEDMNIERVLTEISKDIKGCLSDGFVKVIIHGSEENCKTLREFLAINYQNVPPEKIEYSKARPGWQKKVYIVDIDNVLKLKNPQDISMHRKYGLIYDIRTRR